MPEVSSEKPKNTETVAVIKSVTIGLGGRGDDQLVALVTVKGAYGPEEGFSATYTYYLTDKDAAERFQRLLLETKVLDASNLPGKVVLGRYAAGYLRSIEPISGIYD